MSSIVRKLYHHQRATCLPRVVAGTPDSWDSTIAISGKDHYNGLCIWSPCGRFVAAQTGKAVEIRNQLTLELITILQPAETISHLTGPLAYSPDGRSIACASNTAITIWDIQTGGVAKEIECSSNNILLVWSSDGWKICVIDLVAFIVHIYDVSSGTALSPGILQPGDNPYLWMHDKSFWVMTTAGSRYNHNTIDIFKIGSTLTKVHSFAFPPWEHSEAKITSFSPTTYHASISDPYTLRIFNIQNSECLLDKIGYSTSHSFSKDGSLFTAFQDNTICIWKYTSDSYILWRQFLCQGWSNSPPQFSPNLLSILGHSRNILQVWRLNELLTSKTCHQQYIALSYSGTYVVTAYKKERTVMITNLLAQTPPKLISIDMEIEGLVLTGNVLLVAGLRKLTAWLLTEGGRVFGGRWVGEPSGIWTISRWYHESWMLLVEGQVGVIKLDGDDLHIYNTEDGEVLHPTQAPQCFSSNWYNLSEVLYGQNYLHCHNSPHYGTPPKDSWEISQATLQEGWIKDPEGKHQLWIPVEWRMEWNPADWCNGVTTQFGLLGGKPFLIKF